MSTISRHTQQLIDQYERLFNQLMLLEKSGQVFPGAQKLIADYDLIANASEADLFFEAYGVGNAFAGNSSPFERMIAYELLLEILISHDPVQYHKIHKGSPYYFIGWTAYQYRDFAKSIFYMDAAVSEDLKIAGVQQKTSTRPSLDLFLLSASSSGSAHQVHQDLKNAIEDALEEYRTESGSSLALERFSANFADDLLYNGPKGRSLLTALYTFMLEYQEKKKQILLRSDTGGSIQPFLDHLFDGARLLESILEKRGGGGGTLKPKITGTSSLGITPAVLLANKTLADAVVQHNSLRAEDSSFQDINFATSYIIRNTTGHSLLWPDQFPSTDSYELLFKSLRNSIFWAIEKLWISQNAVPTPDTE